MAKIVADGDEKCKVNVLVGGVGGGQHVFETANALVTLSGLGSCFTDVAIRAGDRAGLFGEEKAETKRICDADRGQHAASFCQSRQNLNALSKWHFVHISSILSYNKVYSCELFLN